jgi:hypothetical protein
MSGRWRITVCPRPDKPRRRVDRVAVGQQHRVLERILNWQALPGHE